jgi:superfamily II DNA or RNA helicase
MLKLEKAAVSASDVARIKGQTTVAWQDINETHHSMECYHETDSCLYLPRNYGVEWLADRALPWRDAYEYGAELPVALPEIPLFDYQKPWVDEIVSLFRKGHHDLVAKAGVGKGKTVMALEAARRLNRVPLIVVDQEFLKKQWMERAKEFFGLTDDQIGIVQSKKCQYQGKVIVIAMLQSLYQKEYPKEFYQYFGLVVFDEVHSVGAQHFSRVLEQFGATYRLGVSATPDRLDVLNKVLRLHLGKVKVSLEDLHRESIVRIVEYDGVLSANVNMSPRVGRYLSEISEDTERNWLIARITLRLHGMGHHTLVVSDRIEQLYVLQEMCVLQGLPREECGMVVGSEFYWGYDKDPFPRVKPKGWDGEAAFTPVCLQMLSARASREVLEERKNTKTVLFTTYSLFSKGVDVPRLSAGVEATPRSRATQVHGRVLRKKEGKLTPLWVTIRDRMSYKAEYQLMKRLNEYTVNNVEIQQWHLDKGTRRLELEPLLQAVKQRNQQLRQAEILMRSDGSFTIQTKSTAPALKNALVSTTEKIIRRRRAG